MVAVTFAVPGRLDQATGGYAYDRRVIAELRKLGCAVDVLDLGEGFPRPTAAAVRDAWSRLQGAAADRPIVIDGLALGVLPEAAQALRLTHTLVALVHHPLALEAGLSLDAAAALRASERTALAAMRHVVVTSPATRRTLVADYGVPTDAITVALPGQDAVAAPSRRASGMLKLLAVGAVVRRKGYDVLVAALDRVRDLDWELVIVGDCTRDRGVAGDLATTLVRLRLGARIRMTGAVSDQELAALYADADVFVLASRHEGYGMAFAEAIGHGLPIIGTTAGAIPETVPAGAGLLVPPDDITALAAALRSMIADAELRGACAAAARRAAAGLPSWSGTARAFLEVLQSLQ